LTRLVDGRKLPTAGQQHGGTIRRGGGTSAHPLAQRAGFSVDKSCAISVNVWRCVLIERSAFGSALGLCRPRRSLDHVQRPDRNHPAGSPRLAAGRSKRSGPAERIPPTSSSASFRRRDVPATPRDHSIGDQRFHRPDRRSPSRGTPATSIALGLQHPPSPAVTPRRGHARTCWRRSAACRSPARRAGGSRIIPATAPAGLRAESPG